MPHEKHVQKRTLPYARKDKKALFECRFRFIPNDFGRMLREDPGCAIAKAVYTSSDRYTKTVYYTYDKNGNLIVMQEKQADGQALLTTEIQYKLVYLPYELPEAFLENVIG